MKLKDNGGRTPHRLPMIKFLPGNTNIYWNEERLICYFILVSIVISYFVIMINDAAFITNEFTFIATTLFSIVFLSTVLNQLLASFSNPGVIEPQDIERHELEPTVSSTSAERQDPINEGHVLVPVKMNGNVVSLKFCKTCKIIRPPRASHCKYCDVCLYRFDHHCPYLANCIGLKNYKNYYYFLLSVVLYCALGFIFQLLHLVDLSTDIGSLESAIESSPSRIVVMVACVLGGSFPLGLLSFHTYILMTGTTTRELLKDTFKSTRNPYTSKNPFRNCYTTLCRTGNPEKCFELVN